MAIYIDPPLWPAHGTVFSHLISDISIQELHQFAAAAGITMRAFDQDHYDVPKRRYADLVAQGAQEVEGRALVRTLLASGLRIPARRRSTSLTVPLLSRWNTMLPGTETLGKELVERWGEPHRRYHDRMHLLDVLDAIELLTARMNDDDVRPPGVPGTDMVPPMVPLAAQPTAQPTVALAAWFHDAVHSGIAGEDEEASAQLAIDRLTALGSPKPMVHEVARLVRLTIGHAPEPGDAAGAVLCDADLAVLARPPAQYQQYLRAVRAEYQHVPDDAFHTGRAAVVRSLLAADPLFSTVPGRDRWEQAARNNLQSEL